MRRTLLFCGFLLTLAACAPAVAPQITTCLATAPIEAQARDGMIQIPAGETDIGSNDFHPEERPARTAQVGAFWIDAHEVTNAEYAAFVAATNYVTIAERDNAGGAVISPRQGVDYSDLSQWWRLAPDATWRTPHGGGSNIVGRDDYPVVQIAYEDALAYAHWRGRDLPTEAEWERAARGGLRNAAYAWGDDARPAGRYLANSYQGLFPFNDTGEDGHTGAAPVGCYPPNNFGLYDMTGNVWEWTKDDWGQAGLAVDGFHVIKGGSFLCSDQYCARYRPASRQAGDDTMGAEHIGFRTIWREPSG
jgi:formylglycine-generating enzyme required for sulfatase activity